MFHAQHSLLSFVLFTAQGFNIIEAVSKENRTQITQKSANFRKSDTAVIQYNKGDLNYCICENLRNLRSKYTFETASIKIVNCK